MFRKVQNSRHVQEDLQFQRTVRHSFAMLDEQLGIYRQESARVAIQLNSLLQANQYLRKEIDKINQFLMAQTIVQFPFGHTPPVVATLAAHWHYVSQYNTNAEEYNTLLIKQARITEYMEALQSTRAAWVEQEQKQKIQLPPVSLPPLGNGELLLWNTRHYNNPKYQNLQTPHYRLLEEMADEICKDTAAGIRYKNIRL